jgi:putative restriction endonuclease
MTVPLSSATVTRLEKVATDNGFDGELPMADRWLSFSSTQVPLRLWLTAFGDEQFVAAVSQLDVARALVDQATPSGDAPPYGAQGTLRVSGIPALHRLVRRAFQLSKTLPDELLHTFERKTAALPRTTEAERLVVQRVGQEIFRAGLIEYWDGRCAITGLAVTELLRASHSKPWAACASDAERLDVFNGLLLAPNLDATFDRGLITVSDDGAVVVSDGLAAEDRRVLGLDTPLRLSRLDDGHRPYLLFHREQVFRGKPRQS